MALATLAGDKVKAMRNDLNALVVLESPSSEELEKAVAEFFSTPDAQQVRNRLAEKQARGRKQGMSIGYRVKSAEKRNGVRYLQDIDVMEASVVTVPANPQARVSAIKESDPELEARRIAMRRLRMQQLARKRA